MSNLAAANKTERSRVEGASMSGPSPISAPTTPPPPPPPPAVPPPPPPPPTGAQGLTRKRRRVRSFFWKTIPEEKVRGKPNIWTLAVRQQQYQIDVRTVEELFGQQEEARPGRAGTQSRGGRSTSSLKETKGEISILDPKRGMNVGIFLKQFKKSNESIVDDIRHGNSKRYGPEALKELLKLLPEAEEVKKLQVFKGDTNRLTLVDSFMYLLIQVPSFHIRIEAMVLKEEFFPSCLVMSREIDIIRAATKELMTCEELHAILHLVLQAGNIMNAGGYAGNAVGFKLSSLLSLADTKANKPGMNLLHFVALEAQKKDEGVLKFPEKLQHVQSAVRVSVENIETELQSLYVRIRSVEEKVQKDVDLRQQLEDFLQSATQTVHDLKKRRLDLRKEGNALIDFFCEDKDTFRLDDCFRIFQDFCLKFKKAVKDNRERELKEAARQQRLRELEEKRFLWASMDHGSSGGFGRSSSENDVDTLTKEGLLHFLQPRSQSPRSPLGRSSSVRRHRHTMSAATADRELHGCLELLSSGDRMWYNSLPRPSRPHHRKTAAWLTRQDDNRELGSVSQLSSDTQVTSPGSDTDPLSPLARFSTAFNISEDSCDNDNTTTVSEGDFMPSVDHNRNFLNKSSSVSVQTLGVERCTIDSTAPAFHIVSHNNNSHVRLADQGDVVVTDLEREMEPPKTLILDTPPSSKDSERECDSRVEWDCKMDSSQFTVSSLREEDDHSTISSTTCDTPLPLDFSLPSKKPVFYILDCMDTDCSVTLDYSETDSSPITRDAAGLDSRTLSDDYQAVMKNQNSFSSNIESTSSNDPLATSSTSAPEALECSNYENKSCAQANVTQEAAADSCNTAVSKEVDRSAQASTSKPSRAKIKHSPKAPAAQSSKEGHEDHPQTASEHEMMHKVVPVPKLSRLGILMKRGEKPQGHISADTRRASRDHSTPARRSEKHARAPRNSSLPPEEPKGHRGIARWARDTSLCKPSIRKPSAKPVRSISKPPPEEKMCRSTMRALAQAQATFEGSDPNTPTHSGHKSSGQLPSFARNTVASSSRRATKDPSTDSNPPTPSRSATLARTGSQRNSANKASLTSGQHTPQNEGKPQGALRRVQSAKASSQNARRGDRQLPLKSNSFSEKCSCNKSPKPTWK